jgi:hypothetical protein
MGYSISIKLTKESKKILDKLCLINWTELVCPEHPCFHFCFEERPSYGPENSFGFDYSMLSGEQRVALYDFVIELSKKCGQEGFYHFDDENSSGRIRFLHDTFYDQDMHQKWVKFFADIMKQI